ncbi:DUF961 family protein [Macrococcus armenti]|uniref:DUF961 family protein n=1 Tax=Macrococcus armenti TaxID=2875764 RepID=UPI001CCEFA9F|nr:DUF961 family protein [Macrococcus armenti]UBH13589.1 YdcP family protein [Macrococcus armenti]
MKPVYDNEKTFGELSFIGKEEKAVYRDGEKTGEVQYAYKLASRAQQEEVVVKIPHEVNFDWQERVRLIDPVIKEYVQSNGSFTMIAYSISASDIQPFNKTAAGQKDTAK